jgi:hypothetical protein
LALFIFLVVLCRKRRTSRAKREGERLLDEPEVENDGNFDKEVSFREKMGWYMVVTMAISVVAQFGVLVFLCFLWAPQGVLHSYWENIMIGGFGTRAVTISALVLRAAVALQATSCTSMLAAIVLERGQLVLKNAAAVSCLRYINSGAHNLITPLIGGPIKHKVMTAILVLTLATTVTLLQFSSTALLFDFNPGYVTVSNNRTDPFSRTPDQAVTSCKGVLQCTDFWNTRAPFYPTFAECSGPPFIAHGISDTGMALRALLPIVPQETRTMLQFYDGQATIFDSRVTCVRPYLNINGTQIAPGSLGTSVVEVTGMVGAAVDAPQVRNYSYMSGVPSLTGVPFSCRVGTRPGYWQLGGNQTGWQLSVCKLSPEIGGLSTPFLNISSFNTRSRFLGEAVMVLNATGREEDWDKFFYPRLGERDNGNWVQANDTDNDEWQRLRPDNHQVELGASLCFSSLYPAEFHIQASGASNKTEIPWSGVLTDSNSSYPLRRQLGATVPRASLSERGLLSLKGKDFWITDLKHPSTATYIYEAANRGWNSTALYQPTTARLFPESDQMIDSIETGRTPWIGMHPYHYRLFQYILQDTLRPALALQVWYTTLFQMAYYDEIEEFDISAPSQQSLFVPALVPTSFHGFTTVVSVLALHLLVVTAIVILFLRKTKYSLLGNSWSTMTQLSTAETDSIYQQTHLMTDGEVAKLLKSEGKRGMRVALGRDSSDGGSIGIKKVQ